jgi:2-keto-4-pentenoate hydratase/2-oxohepta-3-ene-1,7-dioic acid hydratase in catechol pathway
MRIVRYSNGNQSKVAISRDGQTYREVGANQLAQLGGLIGLLGLPNSQWDTAAPDLWSNPSIDLDNVKLLPPVDTCAKIICVGLNYHDHVIESGMAVPSDPTLFGRFHSSIVGHGSPLVRPCTSEQLDFEGELVAVIGRAGRNILRDRALEHVAGYSIFNDGSIRDFQERTTQWTIGKNFDDTGGFGPAIVTADELPPGATGLAIVTRVNGEVVQRSNTSELIFDVASLVSQISVAITLEPGDVIVTGTPAGVGVSRTPPRFMTPGDVCEVEIERIGVLRNAVVSATVADG